MRLELRRRLRSMEARVSPGDEFAGMTAEQLRRLIQEKLSKMVEDAGSYDAVVAAFRNEGLHEAANNLERRREAFGYAAQTAMS